MSPKESHNIELFLSNYLAEISLAEHDCYKLCRNLIELGPNVTLKSIEIALNHYIEIALPKSTNDAQKLKHCKQIVKSIKTERKFIDKELFWEKLV